MRRPQGPGEQSGKEQRITAPAFLALLLALSCVCETKPAPEPSPRSTGEMSCDGREAGERWEVDCNQCYCDRAGQPVCTRMDCRAGAESPGLGGG